MNTATLAHAWPGEPRARAVGIGLWVFIGVATTLFALFITAYALRMDSPDWAAIELPRQLVLSTLLLVAGSVLLELAARAAQDLRHRHARQLLMAGGLAAAAFVCAQIWSWQALADARVFVSGNVAASFFYMLTAMHGLHVIGGLIAWSVVAQSLFPVPAEPRAAAWRIRLTARYWHFLLAVWLALYAALGWLTPEIVRFICGRG